MNKLSDRLPLPWADEAAQIDKLYEIVSDGLGGEAYRGNGSPHVPDVDIYPVEINFIMLRKM